MQPLGLQKPRALISEKAVGNFPCQRSLCAAIGPGIFKQQQSLIHPYTNTLITLCHGFSKVFLLTTSLSRTYPPQVSTKNLPRLLGAHLGWATLGPVFMGYSVDAGSRVTKECPDHGADEAPSIISNLNTSQLLQGGSKQRA